MSGQITNDNGEFLEPVTVIASATGQPDIISTAEFGQYNLALSKGITYTISPQKNTDVTNGVSTYDLGLINQHILDINSFTSPYQYIAADVNKSGSITAFDMLQLRQLILNKSLEFKDNTSWRFIDAGYNFGSDISSTLAQKFSESMLVEQNETQNIDANFISVKIGDVNGTTVPNLLMDTKTEPRNNLQQMKIDVVVRFVEAGTQFDVVFKRTDLSGYNGFQFALDYSGLELLYIKESLLTEVGK